MNIGLIKRLFWPSVLLLVTSYLGAQWFDENRTELGETATRVIQHLVGISLGISLSWFIVRILEVLIWSFLEQRTARRIPRIFRDIVAVFIYFVVGLIIAGTALGKDVTGLWAATGVMSIVLGFALRNMIADVFSGLAINLDQPFVIGDWIQVHPRSVDPMYGEVVEISWRSTRIRKTDNTMLILPNSLISAITLVNFSQPDTIKRFSQSYVLEFGVPPERAIRVLLSAVKSARGILDHPEPKVLIDGTTQWGVEYKIRYWLEVTQVTPRKGRHAVNNKVLEQLYRSGISLAYPKEDLYLAPMPTRQLDREKDRTAILRRVELFARLHDEELSILTEKMSERKFAQGETLVRMDDHGDSMFILVEGRLDMHRQEGDLSVQTRMEQMEPGVFFGEMALFVGEKYSMTVVAVTDAVVFEIQKSDMEVLLESRPEIALQISQIMAGRMAALMASADEGHESQEDLKRDFAGHLLDRMKSIFSSLKKRIHFRN